jgi:hypothetical protein
LLFNCRYDDDNISTPDDDGFHFDSSSNTTKNVDEDNDDTITNTTNARQVVQRCFQQWPRTTKISYLYDMKTVLENIIKLQIAYIERK